MGPITLFDKSFLQSLSLDESVWFDAFFLSNISPVFFVETLADLEKSIRQGRTPEREVRIIADKTPALHPNINMYHTSICNGNLLGYEVPMTGQILVSGGNPVKTADQSGIIFKQPPEVEAFHRWQKNEFLAVERLYAKKWRRMLTSITFEQALQGLNSIGINPRNCKTLEEAKSISESLANISGYSFDRMKFIFSVLNTPEHLFKIILDRWGFSGCPSLKIFAPYAAHVFTIEMFFYIATAANLISQKKVSDKIDLSYLFYLPFCMMFVSSDKIHKRCTPLFLRSDQAFIWGPDLKEDLKRIDEYYDRLPESEKEKGLYAIANRPPCDESFLVSSLWDRFLPNWKEMPAQSLPRKDGVSEHLIKEINKFTDSKSLKPHQVDFDLSSPDVMIIERKVYKRKGKWWLLPKNL